MKHNYNIKRKRQWSVRMLFMSIITFCFFATASKAQLVTISQSFDGTTFPPTGWLNTQVSGTGLWSRVTSASNPTASPHSGAGMAYYNCYSYSSGTSANLITPAFDLTSKGGNTPKVDFSMYRDTTFSAGPYYPDSIMVYANTSANLTGATLLGTVNRLINQQPVVATAGWYRYSFNLPAGFSGATNYLIFKATSGFGNNMLMDSVSYTTYPTTMSYTSSTTVQNTLTVTPGTNNQVVLGMQVVMNGTTTPLSITQFNLSTNGTTNTADIQNAKIYYTGTNPSFSATGQFGTTVAAPSGSYNVTGSQTLSGGTNYFWLTYDIKSTATLNNVVDAELSQITINAVNYTPTITAPTGSRKIEAFLSGYLNVGAGQSITSLTNSGGLFEYINANPVGGNIVALVTSDLTESGTFALNQWTETGTGGYTLTITPNQGTMRTISGSYNGGLIRLNGADRVTIDGRFAGSSGNNLTINNTASSGTIAAIQLQSLGANAGAKRNTIRNVNITTNRNLTSWGIYAGGASLSTSATGADNDSLTIMNNVIRMGSSGIYVYSPAANQADFLTITGNALDSMTTYGIQLSGAKGVVIADNSIRNLQGLASANSNVWGILFTGTSLNAVIERNIIATVVYNGTGGYGGRGIDISTGASGSNVTIRNNMISGMSGDGWSALTSDAIIGIRIQTGSGGVSIYHNTINLFGNANRATTNTVNAGLYISSTSTAIDVRNNIILNSIVNNLNSAGKSYAIYSAAANTAFTNINSNDYYVSGSQGILGFLGSDRTSLGAWKTATAKDQNSSSSTAVFTSNSDLHLTGASIGNYQLRGLTAGGVTTDFDGQTRYAPTPYMGADEIPGTPMPMVVAAGSDKSVCPGDTVSIGQAVVTTGMGGAYFYSWSPSTSLSSGFVAKPVASPTTNTTYIVTVTDTMGISSTDTVNVTVKVGLSGIQTVIGGTFMGKFNAGTIADPDSACVGDTLTYTQTPPTGFTNADYGTGWEVTALTLFTPFGNIPNGNIATALPSASGPGYFRFTPSAADGDSLFIGVTKYANMATGCEFTLTRYIRVVKKPVINLGADTTICVGTAVILDAGAGFSSYSWSNGPATRINNVSTPGTYTATVTNASGCASSDAIVVSNKALPLLNLGADTSICTGNSLVLNATTGMSSYQWSNGGSGSSISVSTAGSYWARVTAANGCSKYDTIVVGINSLPVISFNTVAPFCAGGFTVISMTGSFSSYLWSDNTSGSSLTVNTPGNYSVTVTDANGCSSKDSVDAIMNNLPVVTLGADTTVCDGSPVTFTANTTYPVVSYIWSNNTSGNAINVNAAGQYDVTVTDSNNCSANDVVNLFTNPLPVVTIGNDTTICDGNIVTFDAGAGFASYLWSDNTSGQSINATASGNYSVTVTDINNCSNMASADLIVLALPQVFLGSDITVCPEVVVNLDAGPGFAGYVWSTSDTTRAVNVKDEGVYSVTVTGANGCTNVDSVELFNHPLVSSAFTATPVAGAKYDFTATGAGDVYFWDFGDGNTSSLQNPTHQYNANGNFTVKLKVFSLFGCIDSSSQLLNINNLSAADIIKQNFSFIAYPNPFNSESTLRYTLPSDANVNIEVYDVMGRNVLEVANGKQSAGTHEYSLGAENFTNGAGIYYVRLVVNGEANMIRLVQVK
jgi:hypothetical protein